MFNKISLVASLVIVSIVHLSAFALYKPEPKKEVVLEKPQANSISLRKVTLKKKEIQKKPVVEEVKKVQVKKQVKKIVKKAKRKVAKRIKKKVVKKKPIKKPVEKPIKKEVKKPAPQVVSQTVAKVPKITKRVVVSPATKELIKNAYLLKVKRKIEQNKIYPKRAKRLRQEGKVRVSFLITKNGNIRNIKIVGKSSYKRLNNASLELLKKIARFEAIPKELGKNTWTIEVPINYSIIN